MVHEVGGLEHPPGDVGEECEELEKDNRWRYHEGQVHSQMRGRYSQEMAWSVWPRLEEEVEEHPHSVDH